MSDSGELPVLINRYAAESDANTVSRPLCNCLNAQYYGWGWDELSIHSEQQDTTVPAWHKLLQLIDDAAKDERTELSVGKELSPIEWTQIVTLPPSIGKLKSVKRLVLYGSSIVEIPPEIGEMTNLEVFEPYTSYRLHWFPYEITCTPSIPAGPTHR